MTNTSSIMTAEIANALKITERSVRKRAKNENWPTILEACNGGHRMLFPIDSLPDPIKFAIYSHRSQALLETSPTGNLPVPKPKTTARIQAKPIKPIVEAVETPIRITLDQQPSALAKASIIKLYTSEVAKAPYGEKEKAKANFILAYNSGLAFPELFQKLGKLSVKTIEAWKLKLKATQDCFNLADQRGKWRKGACILSLENTDILLRCVLHPNKPLKAEAIRLAINIMHREGVINGASEQTYRRWLENWIANNYETWIMVREGKKAWNDKCCFSIPRDFSRIAVGDVLVADGHVLNFEIINPFTGKPKRMILILWYDMKSSFPLGWEILPTENTQGIASALRRAIIQLGKLPAIAYLDNGRAFSSRFFNGEDLTPVTGLFERMGMETIFAWPYHGQSKTIERFFKTFAELERYTPTYTGTSIENKPPRMMRNEIIHRRLYDQTIGGKGLTLWQAHFLVAIWFDEYVSRPQRGHLKGACPLEVFEADRGPGVDPVALRYLMMAEHISQPGKEGIRFLGQNYYHPDLASIRKKVLIRYDLQERDSILVFEEDDSAYLCTANVLEACHPVASLRGSDADKQHLSNMIEMKKHAEKKVSRLALDMLRNTVMPETITMLSMIPDPQEPKPIQSDIKQLPSPEQIASEVAVLRAENQEYTRQEAISRQQEAEQKAEMDRILRQDFEENFKTPEPLPPSAELRYDLERMKEADRYETLMDMEIMGQMITKHYKAFMRYFELGPEYLRHQEYFESRKATLKSALSKEIK
jgi:putative transposase